MRGISPGNGDIQPASIFDIDEVTLRRTLITSIDHVSTGRAYKIFNASAGTRVYIDRPYAISSLPSGLAGMNMIVTSNEDDYVSTSKHLRFTLSKNADVYLAISADAAKLPSWATGWTDTGMTIQVHGTFKVYRKPYPQGSVTLGGNDRKSTGASSNYFVLAVGS